MPRSRFRWAEQLRSAVLCTTNNIAEGSGSHSKAEFAQFLNYARSSIFETADTPLIALPALLKELEEISRMIHSFQKSLF